MKVWILTEEHNLYDQMGEYFVAAYKEKPTREQIEQATDYFSDEYIGHILNGGGCMYNGQDNWYWLREEELK